MRKVYWISLDHWYHPKTEAWFELNEKKQMMKYLIEHLEKGYTVHCMKIMEV